jgi:oxalate decarboxylase/phosphoglucose isomerase-like protein (cupin superfamily)
LRDCEGVTPREAVVRKGEILFVPRGWWHCAINLEDTLAITQNYVSRANLRHVLEFLQSPHAAVLVSGVSDAECTTLGPRFVEALEREGYGMCLRNGIRRI